MREYTKTVGLKTETAQNLIKMLDLTRPDDSLLVMMYGSPDPDSIASAMALRELLTKTKGLSRWVFASTEPIRREQNQELAKAMRLNIRLLSQVDPTAYRLVALVDAQPSFFGDTPPHPSPALVFDHHPRQGDWKADLIDIRPQYGSQSTIMTEYLQTAGVRISKTLHTALLYGIKTDTDNFDRDTIAEDIAAYTYHTRHANMPLIRRIELNQTPAAYLKYFEHAYHHMKYYRGRRVAFLGRVESPDVCVQVADFYLHLIGTSYVVIAGVVSDRLIMIFRSDGYRQNCGKVAQYACGMLGQGGGHRSAARMEIPLDTLKERLKGDWTQENVDLFLRECLKQGSRAAKSEPAITPEDKT